ncbi:MAG TPA: GNAT family protein [Thermomicrobiales bacterium]|nr:GNAT family protein [Thermomicrobiales bacterium]
MNSVSLHRATPVDAPRLLAWREEASAGRYQPIRPTTLASLQERLAKEADRPLDADFEGTATFIIEASGEPTGWITLREVNREHRTGDIGYTIGEAFRGRGLATAALRALLPLAFETADLDRLQAVAAVDNMASRRVLERADFQCEGIARAYLIIRGQRIDHARYALLRDDWRETREAATSSN